MTQPTANLSIGLETSQAKNDLADLKKWLQTEMRALVVDIDPLSLDKAVRTRLARRPYVVRLDTREMEGELANAKIGERLGKAGKKFSESLAKSKSRISDDLHTAIREGFSGSHSVRWNRETLIRQVRSALQEGFAEKREVNLGKDALYHSIHDQVQRALVGHSLQVKVSTQGQVAPTPKHPIGPLAADVLQLSQQGGDPHQKPPATRPCFGSRTNSHCAKPTP